MRRLRVLVAAHAAFPAGRSERIPRPIPPPPANGSPQLRAELDELLSIQAARTPAEREAARADRKKVIQQFYGAPGLRASAAGSLVPLSSFMERVESEVSLHVRAAKLRFARPRPYLVKARLHPCIDDVADNQSYPSGHSTYGFVAALLLADMVPERRKAAGVLRAALELPENPPQ